MAKRINCGNKDQGAHFHATVQQVRDCYSRRTRTTPVVRPDWIDLREPTFYEPDFESYDEDRLADRYERQFGW